MAIQKVKSHIGIVGNEKADRVAQAAAKGEKRAGRHHVEQSDNDPHASRAWLAQCKDASAGQHPHYLANLTGAVCKTAAPVCEAHYAGSGTYANLHQEHHVHWNKTAALARMSARAPARRRARATQHAWGQAPCAKRDQQRGGSANKVCPLCKAREENSGHILGGCAHPKMAACYVKRHNEAVQIIASAIVQGEMGGGALSIDACAKQDLQVYMAGNTAQAHRYLEISEETSRPDIVFVPGATAEQLRGINEERQSRIEEQRRCQRKRRQPQLTGGREAEAEDEEAGAEAEAVTAPATGGAADRRASTKVIMVEVGYCADLSMPRKIAHKHWQHTRRAGEAPPEGCMAERDDRPCWVGMARAAEEAGWQVQYRAGVETVALGHTGHVHVGLATLLKELKVPKSVVERTMRDLALHALASMRNIEACRGQILKEAGRAAG